MKALLKPIFFGTALSTLGVCFTFSHAASISSVNNTVENQMVVMTQIFPTSKTQRFREPESFLQVFDKPLVRIPLTTSPVEQFKRARKKNHFFELATVFNDKLHQFIADINLPDLDAKELGADTGSTMLHTTDKKTCKS